MSSPLADAWALRLLDAMRREELASFVAGAVNVLVPNKPYRDNYHIAAIAYALERAASGDWRRQLIACPPRHLKSVIASVCFPAWLLGRNPHAKIVCISHTADVAIKHHNDCRRLMASPYYRHLFPGTVIARDKNTETEFRTTAGGERLSTSVGGPLTGRGGDVIVVDDALKADEADSDSKRQAVNAWFANSVASRLDDPRTGAIVAIAQRLHEDDLLGVLLDQGNWKPLILPAIAEQDEKIQIGPHAYHHRRENDLLHAERVSLAELEAQKRALGEAAYSAQYQQRPAPLGGVIIKRDWVQRYSREPERRPGHAIVQSWDTGLKAGDANDYSACLTFLRRGREHYLLHVRRERLEFSDLLKTILAHRKAYGPGPLLIEDAAAGASILQALKASPSLPNAISIKPEGDKVGRLNGQSYKFEAGEIYLPESAPWLATFEAELFAFPKCRHDDQVDALSQYLRWCDRRRNDFAPGPVCQIID